MLNDAPACYTNLSARPLVESEAVAYVMLICHYLLYCIRQLKMLRTPIAMLPLSKSTTLTFESHLSYDLPIHAPSIQLS